MFHGGEISSAEVLNGDEVGEIWLDFGDCFSYGEAAGVGVGHCE